MGLLLLQAAKANSNLTDTAWKTLETLSQLKKVMTLISAVHLADTATQQQRVQLILALSQQRQRCLLHGSPNNSSNADAISHVYLLHHHHVLRNG